MRGVVLASGISSGGQTNNVEKSVMRSHDSIKTGRRNFNDVASKH